MDGIQERLPQIGTDREGQIQNCKMRQDEFMQPFQEGYKRASNFVAETMAGIEDLGESVVDTTLTVLDLASPEHRVARNHCQNLEKLAGEQKTPAAREHFLRREVEFATTSMGFDHPTTARAESSLLNLRREFYQNQSSGFKKAPENQAREENSNPPGDLSYLRYLRGLGPRPTQTPEPSIPVQKPVRALDNSNNYYQRNLQDGRWKHNIYR